MTHTYSVKHVLFALGLGAAALVGCDNSEPMSMTPTYSGTSGIHAQLTSAGCAASGCHNATSTASKLQIAADAQAAYDNLINNKYVIKNDATNSPLIKVPSTGTATSGAGHVKTLSGTKLTDWQAWVNGGAPF